MISGDYITINECSNREVATIFWYDCLDGAARRAVEHSFKGNDLDDFWLTTCCGIKNRV